LLSIFSPKVQNFLSLISQLEVLIHFYILQNTALRSLKNENTETSNAKNAIREITQNEQQS